MPFPAILMALKIKFDAGLESKFKCVRDQFRLNKTIVCFRLIFNFSIFYSLNCKFFDLIIFEL